MILSHGDGLRTTAHVAEYPLADFELRVALLPAATSLLDWCATEGLKHALVGGFYIRQPQDPTDPRLKGMPLGDLRSYGEPRDSIAFDPPWGDCRACVHSTEAGVTINRRDRLPGVIEGDLLQAGPLLVDDGRLAGMSEEGFSAGSGQFDSDITEGRHPRAALGLNEETLMAVTTDGRTDGEEGLTLDELAETMLGLGARYALNLDGGGSASMVTGGNLVNVPREFDGTAIPGGRTIPTALVFLPRR